MSDSTPSRPTADRNLLFGILALQLDFISRDAFLAALQAWVLDKGKSLARILQDQGQLAPDRLVLLNALVAAHLKGHQNDPRHSLEAVAVPSSVREQLESLRDGDLQTSLAVVGSLVATDSGASRPQVPKPDHSGSERRYRIVRPHARGELGQVYVAEDRELHREVALKEIQPQYAQDPRSRQRFLREAEIIGRLEHPGIVPVYGLGQHADGRPFYAMRFVKGTNLQEAIHRFHAAEDASRDPAERSLAWRRLLGRFVAVCQAVAYAHSRGVLHRDLKPSNIVLGKHGETLVVDWSLAKTIGRPEATTDGEEQTLGPSAGSGVEPTQLGSAIGTPAYMSPEQALGQLEVLSPASDVYSLGATLYTLLTGKPPFESKEVREILRQVQEGRLVPPQQVNPAVPPALAAICLKAMARQPKARYVSALDLATDLEHWLAEEPVTAHTEPFRMRAWRWMRRRPTLVSGSLAALVAGVVFLGVLAALLLRQNLVLAQANVQERQAREELAQKQEALAQAHDTERRANAELDEKNKTLEQANASERAAREEVIRKNQALAQANTALDEKHRLLRQAHASERAAREELARQHEVLTRAHDKERRANAELDEKNKALEKVNANERAAREELLQKHQALTRAHDKERQTNTELARKNQALTQANAKERAAREELTRQHEALTRTHDKERQVNAELALKNQALEKASANERAAKLLAEASFALANQAIEDYLIHVADDSRLQQADLRELRTKLLQAAGGFYAKLLEQKGDSQELRAARGSAHLGLGVVLKNTGRPSEAIAEERQAIRVLEKLLADAPTHPRYQELLVQAYHNLSLSLRVDQLAEAAPVIQQARALGEKLVTAHPKVLDYQLLLAQVYGNSADIDRLSGQVQDALEWYTKALATAETVRPRAPNHPQVLNLLRLGHAGRAAALHRLSRHREALQDWDRALERATGPDRVRYRVWRALSLAHLGEHAQAMAEAGDLAKTKEGTAENLYNLACGCALASVAVRQDGKLPEAEQDKLGEEYAVRALDLLKHVAAAGYFNTPDRLAHVKADPDLDALRGRADFTSWLGDLEKSKVKEPATKR